MIICPNCSHINPEGASNCESCLTPLPIMIQCPQCGQSVQDDAAFCGNCGYNLKQNPVPNPETVSTEVIEETAVIKGLESEKTIPPPVTFPEIEVEAEEEEIEEFTQPFFSNKAEVTQIQAQLAVLLHVQTNQKIELPLDLKVMHMGRPNDQIPPDLDVSSFPDADIVSRIHADIRKENDGYYYLEDMGSANGTYVNGQRLHQGDRHRLQSGDRLCLGKEDKVSFIFSLS